MQLKEIIAKLRDPNTPPGDLSTALMHLSADYAHKSEEFRDVLASKAEQWEGIRSFKESDKQAERAWEASIEGRHETALRLELKSIEKLMSAIKAHLRVKETEARNQF